MTSGKHTNKNNKNKNNNIYVPKTARARGQKVPNICSCLKVGVIQLQNLLVGNL